MPQVIFGSTATRVPAGIVAPAPAASTVPANSCPRVTGIDPGYSPCRMCRSVPQIPQASTRISRPRGPGSGVSISRTRKVCKASSRTARILIVPSHFRVTRTSDHAVSHDNPGFRWRLRLVHRSSVATPVPASRAGCTGSMQPISAAGPDASQRTGGASSRARSPQRQQLVVAARILGIGRR
jgi:hypothetical protein